MVASVLTVEPILLQLELEIKMIFRYLVWESILQLNVVISQVFHQFSLPCETIYQVTTLIHINFWFILKKGQVLFILRSWKMWFISNSIHELKYLPVACERHTYVQCIYWCVCKHHKHLKYNLDTTEKYFSN